MMEPTDPSDISTSSADEDQPEAADAAPVHKVNIREVKQKTLALLTELYKTETGDVRRMAMTLLQTLYTIEEEHQVQEMNGKIQKLMKMIEEQKQEQAEMEEASLAASSMDGSIGFFNRSRAHTEESNLSVPAVSENAKLSPAASKDEADSANSSSSSLALKENKLIKRWQEKLENMRKPETTKPSETADAATTENNASNTPVPPVSIQQWRESVSTRMDASRERFANGWRESTTKLQQGWNKQRENNNQNNSDIKTTVEAKPTEEESDHASVSTEGSSAPPSPHGSETQCPSEQNEPKPDALIKVFKNAFKDGIDSKQSRESLELAIQVRKEKARNRWAETRAKWNWNNANANNNTAATPAQA